MDLLSVQAGTITDHRIAKIALGLAHPDAAGMFSQAYPSSSSHHVDKQDLTLLSAPVSSI